jgi:hypothetical protein
LQPNIDSINIGSFAGQSSAASGCVNIGVLAGANQGQSQCVNIGFRAGFTGQKYQCVAIGSNAGRTNMGIQSLAIGVNCEATGSFGIAIGNTAKANNYNAIAIGACTVGQTGSICISNVTMSTQTQLACYINPIRGTTDTTPVMTYDATNKEVRYNSSSQRYKTNIRPVIIESSKVNLLQPKLYDVKDDETKKDILGYIAEDVAAIERVFAGYSYTEKGDEQAETIDWFKILIYAVEEIKQLKDRIQILEMNLNTS